MKKRVLSGIRATGRLHLGNYLGAVKGMLELQDNPDYETLYMVADLHAATTPYDPNSLKKNAREVVLDYLAAGLDPEKSIIFIQSEVPAHSELAYYLSTVVSIAKLSHLPTYKEKVKQYPESNTMALLYYPILMAADILVYKAGLVPVGIDQEPHLEITREIARKMNDVYKTSFPEPVRFPTSGEYIPSLTGEGKMSKSVEGSYINLTDDLETIKRRLATAPTDSGKGIIIIDSTGDTINNLILPSLNHPTQELIERLKNKKEYPLYFDKISSQISFGVKNLLTLVEMFEGKEKREMYEEKYLSDGIKYSELKEELAEAIYNELKPIQEKRKYFEDHLEEVEKIIAEGAQKAQEIAKETIKEVKEKMGF